MRLQPVQLLDDSSGLAKPSYLAPPRGLSRRALITAAAGGGAALGLAAWLRTSPAEVAAAAAANHPAPGLVDPLDRLVRLGSDDLLRMHQAVVFAAFTAATDDPRVELLADRLLEVVLAPSAAIGRDGGPLRARAASSLTTLACLRGGPATLVAALPQLEAIR